MNGTSLWIVRRLKRRGYLHMRGPDAVATLRDESTSTWHMTLPRNDSSLTHGPCDLTITVEQGANYIVARFRLSGQSFVHFKAVLNLGHVKGWRELEQFEAMYQATHGATLEDFANMKVRQP